MNIEENILEIKDLTISFNKRIVVDHVDFSIKKGEVFSLVGESGSGKTLTALSILRLLPESALLEKGEILYQGKNVFDFKQEELRKFRGMCVSMVFQEPFTALNPVIKIGTQIEEALITHNICSKGDAKSRITQLLDTVKLRNDIVDKYPHELSGGMQQRVMLAIGLSCDPDVLILDEPTTALDVSIQKHILDLIKQIQKDRHLSILFITHDLSVVNNIADSICVMKEGRVIEQGEKNDILIAPENEYTKHLIECIPRLGDKRKRLPSLWEIS